LPAPPVRIDISRENKPTTEEIYARICQTARIPLEEVRKYPHGNLFEIHETVQEKDADCRDGLDVGNDYMMRDLADVASFDVASDWEDAGYPFRLISRRSNNFHNSSGTRLYKLHRGKPYNACFMRPEDIAELGLQSGDRITIRSRHDGIPSIVEDDRTMRRKVLAMYHCFGGLVEEDGKFTELGSNVGRLVPNDKDYDPITGIPRMGNIPVRITPGWP